MNEPAAPPRSRRVWTLLATGAITIAVLAALLGKIEPSRVLATLGRAEPIRVVLAIALSLAGSTLLSAETLRQTLRAVSVEVPYRVALGATLGNLAFHAALPAGAGHASRIGHLVRLRAAPADRGSAAFALLLWLKVAGLFLVALLGSVAAQPLGATRVAGLAVVTAGFVGSAFAAPALGALAARVAPRVAWRTLRRLLGRVADSRAVLRRGALARALGYATLAGALQVGIFLVVLDALRLTVDVSAVLAGFPLCLLGAKLPITVAGLGTREALTVTLLAGQAQPAELLAASLAFSVIEQVLPGLVGAPLAFRFVARTLEGPGRGASE